MVLIGIMVSALDTGNGFAYTMAGITIVNAGVNAGVMLYYRDWTADMVEEHTRLTEIQDQHRDYVCLDTQALFKFGPFKRNVLVASA